MYLPRRVWLFHKQYLKRIFEFNSEDEEQEKKSQGWVENPADLRVEIQEESIDPFMEPEKILPLSEISKVMKPRRGRPNGSKGKKRKVKK